MPTYVSPRPLATSTYTVQPTRRTLRPRPGPTKPASTRRSPRGILVPMSAEPEAVYTCPECGELVVVPVDPSAGSHQRYTEDCPVCCHPNVLEVRLDPDGAIVLEVEPE